MSGSLFDMDAFVRDKVVPDVIDAVPPAKLQVTFGSTSFDPGTTLTPTKAKDRPIVTFVAEAGSFYSLLEIDHDVPSRTDHSRADFLHWKVINIQGNDVTTGKAVAEYLSPGPSKGSGFHRYTILLMKQLHGQIDPSQYTVISNTEVNGRGDYGTREFINKYHLQIVAGNFFQAEWDDYVPILQAKLGFTPPTTTG